ncbi:hypothetical protein Vretifemale_5626 [Volvox reticuliferus]|uniref:FCP1 homology domain-containing protein n=1 Tax=Volvox reticuliferus TaxID=1737510 RepID=A0A8J4C8A3_9CHLO|nr:hypothetical protein Vretifemale_5626 [Volvox reticuliferus]
MTATLQSGGIRVDQLVNIQITFDDRADGVVLSVSSTCGPTSPESTNCQECKSGFVVLLHNNGAEPSTYAVAEETLSSVESSRKDEGTIVAGIEQSEDCCQSNVTCIGPSTPEQADTIGAKDRDESGKPSLGGPAETGQPEHCSWCYSDKDKIISSVHSAEQDVRERFTHSGASVENSDVGHAVDSGLELVAVINQDGCTPPSEDCPLSSQAGEPNSASGASDGKAESLSATQPFSTEVAGCGSASMLAVPNLSFPGGLCTPTTDLTPCNDEPVTPTAPRMLANAPLLPPPTDPRRMTLVLDLDGTLIASEDEPHAPVPFDYCVDEERFVWLRPGLRRFLDSVRPHFEVVLFTAAGESWATSALQRIDPGGTIFDSRLYRDHTVFHGDWPWVKDLSRLGRDLARVVIVDDNPLMFMYQPDNALHVAAYDPQLTGDNDDVLEQVLDILMHKVLIADDVREVLRNLEEPITASCMVARHAAAKAAAASGYTAAPRLVPASGSQGRKITGPAAAIAPPQQLIPCTAAASLTVASAARVVKDALANQTAPAAPTAGRLSRRKRRLLKLQQQQQGLSIPTPHHSVSGRASALPFPAISAPQQQADNRNGGTGSRFRGSWGPCVTPATGPRVAAVPAITAPTAAWARAPAAHEDNLLTTAATLAAAARRPPIIISRVRGPKQAPVGGPGKRITPSLLQQPEQQLKLKLKLLQLQRAQEEGGVDEEGRLDDDGEGVMAPVAVPMNAESLHGRSDSSSSIVCQQARVGHCSSSIGPRSLDSISEARPGALEPAVVLGIASIAAAEQGASLAAGCGPGQVCSVSLAARADSAQLLTNVAIADSASANGVNNEQKVGEPKPRTRRRRRRRPAEAPSQDEGCDASGRAAKASPVALLSPKSGDMGTDLIAIAVRRIVRDRS